MLRIIFPYMSKYYRISSYLGRLFPPCSLTVFAPDPSKIVLIYEENFSQIFQNFLIFEEKFSQIFQNFLIFEEKFPRFLKKSIPGGRLLCWQWWSGTATLSRSERHLTMRVRSPGPQLAEQLLHAPASQLAHGSTSHSSLSER